jgi:hypothetical protein
LQIEEVEDAIGSSVININRRVLISGIALLPALTVPLLTAPASAQTATSSGALPSWNEGTAKQAILDFVRDTTGPGSPKFVLPEDRIATFDQDGTLWVEHLSIVKCSTASTGCRCWPSKSLS